MLTPTRSPAATSATSSRTPARRPSLFTSPYAVSAQPEGALGLFGGVLLKPWMPRTGGWNEDVMQKPGTLVPGDVTSKWPLPNRLAMDRAGFIQYFQNEREAELAFSEQDQVTAAVQQHPTRARVMKEASPAVMDRISKMNQGRAAKRLARQLVEAASEGTSDIGLAAPASVGA